MKKNVKLERLVTKLNRATKLLAETASALTVEVESRHRVIDMLSSMPAAGLAKATPKARAKVKAKTKAKTRMKRYSKPHDPNAPRRGRPAGSGRFETRADLEAFVRGRRRAGALMSDIADEAGVSAPVISRILRKFMEEGTLDATSPVVSPSVMAVGAAD